MAGARKDNKGRVLLKGESYREKDKRYQFKYTDSMGRTKYIYSKDIITLRKREEELMRNKVEGIDNEQAKRQTLNHLFDKYISTRPDLADRTRASYIYQYDAHVRETIGKRRVKDIKYSDILLFYITLMEEKKLSYGTIEHLQRELHPAFEMAVRDNIIRSNPTSSVLAQLKRQTGAQRGKRVALTPEEQSAFLEFMDGHVVLDHWKPIFIFLLGTGVRVSELSGLCWEDIDFEKGLISIEREIVYFAGKKNPSKQKLFVSDPKTFAGIRKIPIVKEVRTALESVKKYQQENGLVSTREIDGYSNFVFLDRFGTTYIQHNLDRALERIIKQYKEYARDLIEKKHSDVVMLPHFTCHNLRHTFCTRLCENETNIKVIQSIMGRVDIKTTMNIYAEVSEKKKQESLNQISEKLNLF